MSEASPLFPFIAQAIEAIALGSLSLLLLITAGSLAFRASRHVPGLRRTVLKADVHAIRIESARL